MIGEKIRELGEANIDLFADDIKPLLKQMSPDTEMKVI